MQDAGNGMQDAGNGMQDVVGREQVPGCARLKQGLARPGGEQATGSGTLTPPTANRQLPTLRLP